MSKYTPGAWIRQTLIILLTLAALAIWGTVAYQELTKPEPETIPMANQHITWSGAGYDGIYGGRTE